MAILYSFDLHWSIELGETRMRFSSVAKKGYTPTLSSPIGSGLTLEGAKCVNNKGV